MAKYRAKSLLYIEGRTVNPGETFETDHAPGAQWEPVDEDAHAAVEEYTKSRTKQGVKVAPAPEMPIVAANDPATVPIPEGWRDLMPHKRINLARRLGAPVKGTGTAEADACIEAELTKRAAPAEPAKDASDGQ